VSGGGWINIDITAAVNAWLSNPAANLGVLLRPTSNNNNFDDFVSSNAVGADAQYMPQLVIQTGSPSITLLNDDNFTVAVDGSVVMAPTGNHVITLNAGNSLVSGGSGHSVVVFRGAGTQYNVVHNADGTFTVSDSATGRDGNTRLSDIEVVSFSNKMLFIED